jgi:hypothetical protein
LIVFRNDADKVAASRAKASREASTRAENKRREDAREAILGAGEQCEALIPTVLDRLAAQGYPGIEEITVQVPRTGLGRLLGATRETKAGAYPLSSYSYGESHSRPAGTDHIRLLSSGRLAVGSGSYSVGEFVQEVMNHAGIGVSGRGNDLAAFSVSSLDLMVEELMALLLRG